MGISIYLAKVIGLYFVILSVGFMVNRKALTPVLKDFMKSPPLMFLSGFLALVIGILLVTSHNLWVMDWRVLITLVGWLSLIKGIVRVTSPHTMLKTGEKFMLNTAYYYPVFLAQVLLGMVLLYNGYL